jgi:hypothetical protein
LVLFEQNKDRGIDWEQDTNDKAWVKERKDKTWEDVLDDLGGRSDARYAIAHIRLGHNNLISI